MNDLIFQMEFSKANPEIIVDNVEQYDNVVYAIEATLTIVYKGLTFFSEDLISVFELCIQLEKWLEQITMWNNVDFFYTCLDWDDEEGGNGSILKFTRVEPDLWEIDSVWKKSNDTIKVKRSELIQASIDFVGGIKTYLDKKYKIDFIEYYRKVVPGYKY